MGAAGIHQRCVLSSCSFRLVLLKGVRAVILTTENLESFKESPDWKHCWGCRTLNAACCGVLRGIMASQDWTVYPEPRSGAHDFLLHHATLLCWFFCFKHHFIWTSYQKLDFLLLSVLDITIPISHSMGVFFIFLYYVTPFNFCLSHSYMLNDRTT